MKTIMLIGMKQKYLKHLFHKFNKKFKFIAIEYRSRPTYFPPVDLCIVMSKFAQHDQQDTARKYYGRDKIIVCSGSMTTLQRLLETL